MLEICQFRPEEIDEAIEGMDGLQQILEPVLRRSVINGNGTEQDVRQFQRHVMLAKHALIAMGDFLERRMGPDQPDSAEPPAEQILQVLESYLDSVRRTCRSMRRLNQERNSWEPLRLIGEYERRESALQAAIRIVQQKAGGEAGNGAK